jgi:hypothetical protein
MEEVHHGESCALVSDRDLPCHFWEVDWKVALVRGRKTMDVREANGWYG